MTDPWLFLLAVLTILGTPGPTNTLLATGGAMAGVARSLPLLIGEISGYLIAISAIYFLLQPIIIEHPWIGSALKVTVAAYLIWVAVRLWLRGSGLAAPVQVRVRTVFVTTLLNPKAIIFALSVFPAVHPQLHWYAAAFVGCVLTVGSCWILVGHLLGAAAGQRHAQLVPRVASVTLTGFAGFMVASAFG